MKIQILAFLSFFLCCVSCRQDNDGEDLAKTVNSVDIYVAGTENNQACYWKNTVKTILPGGNNIIPTSIYADNNHNVYVLAMDNSNGANYFFWKNGIKTTLSQYLNIAPNVPNNNTYFQLTNFFFKDGKLYIAGLVKNPSPTSNQDLYQYYYWINGVPTLVFQQEDYSPTASIYPYGSDIYVPLTHNLTVSPTAPTSWDLGYYKNGVYHFVTTNSTCFGFDDEGGNLKMMINDGNTHTKYYKNLSSGAITPVPAILNSSEHYNIVKDGNDTYYIRYKSYYKNNTLVTMNNPDGFNQINGFIAKNQNIYMIRTIDGPNPEHGYKMYVNDVLIQSIITDSGGVPQQDGMFSTFYVTD